MLDILLIVVINTVLIVVVKLLFMFLTSLEADTNYKKALTDFLKLSFRRNKSKEDDRRLKGYINSFINFSSLIGFVERTLYIAAFMAGEYQLITIVIGVKTLVRFPEISQKQNNAITAEKYILGTLLNIIFSIIIASIFS